MRSHTRGLIFALSLVLSTTCFLFSEELSLWQASKEGNVEAVKSKLAKGDNPNKTRTDWQLPLDAAAANGHLEIVKLLLENGADPNTINNGWNSPIASAATNGHLEIVKLLLDRGANPNLPGYYGDLPLGLAALNGHIEIAETLLNHGTNPNLVYKKSWLPLTAAAKNGSLEMVKLLLSHDAKPDFRADRKRADSGLYTPLMIASMEGKAEIVKELLAAGAKPDFAPDKYHNSPLVYAALNDHAQVIETFIKAGVNPSLLSGGEYVETYSICGAARSGSSSAIRSLVQNGVSVDLMCNLGECKSFSKDEYTPLMLATKYHKTRAVATLLELGADYTKLHKDKTILDMAQDSSAIKDLLVLVNNQGLKALKSSIMNDKQPWWRWHNIDFWHKKPDLEISEVGNLKMNEDALWRGRVYKSSPNDLLPDEKCMLYSNEDNEFEDSLIELATRKIGPKAEAAGVQAVWIDFQVRRATYTSKPTFLGELAAAALSGAVEGAQRAINKSAINGPPYQTSYPELRSSTSTTITFEIECKFMTYKN